MELHASEYSDRIAVYTDGSVKHVKAACAVAAVYSSHFKLFSRLKNRTSIFTSELQAILYAVVFITSLPGQYILYSDSMSSVIVLRSLSTSTNQVLHKMYKEISKLPEDKLIIEWVPSHTPLEFFFQEQSYSSLHSGRSLAWDHVHGDIDDPCGAIADFCGVIADLCGVVAIHEVIGGR